MSKIMFNFGKLKDSNFKVFQNIADWTGSAQVGAQVLSKSQLEILFTDSKS